MNKRSTSPHKGRQPNWPPRTSSLGGAKPKRRASGKKNGKGKAKVPLTSTELDRSTATASDWEEADLEEMTLALRDNPGDVCEDEEDATVGWVEVSPRFPTIVSGQNHPKGQQAELVGVSVETWPTLTWPKTWIRHHSSDRQGPEPISVSTYLDERDKLLQRLLNHDLFHSGRAKLPREPKTDEIPVYLKRRYTNIDPSTRIDVVMLEELFLLFIELTVKADEKLEQSRALESEAIKKMKRATIPTGRNRSRFS